MYVFLLEPQDILDLVFHIDLVFLFYLIFPVISMFAIVCYYSLDPIFDRKDATSTSTLLMENGCTIKMN